MTDRLEALKQLAAENPGDVFAHYGLGMACARAGRFAEALAEFEQVLSLDAHYTVAYFQAGQVLEKLGRFEGARAIYRRGIDLTTRLGQRHAREQLEGALELLG